MWKNLGPLHVKAETNTGADALSHLTMVEGDKEFN
jgi:hypothetical protein